MKNIRVCLGTTLLCLLCSTAWAQSHHPVPRGMERPQWAQPPNQSGRTQLSQASDPHELRTEADELAKLAQSVLYDIDKLANQGLVAKELVHKLERIQKLSKNLRSEIQP